MTFRLNKQIALGFILLAAVGLSATDLDAVVGSFYPSQLQEKAVAQGRASAKPAYAFAVLDSAIDGTPVLVVAAYTNGIDGMFRVLKASSGSFVVVYENEDFDGANPQLELVDIDGDGKKEIVAHSTSFTGISDIYIYRWDGSSLIDLLPAGAELVNASLIDLYHDGTMQLISVADGRWTPSSGRPIDNTNFVYRVTNGRFEKDRELILLDCFARSTSRPATATRAFTTNPSGPFRLTVFNGSSGGTDRISSAHIRLNGTEVLGPSQLNQTVSSVSVSLANVVQQDTLEVQLDSQPGGKIWVAIENMAPAPPN